MVVVVAKAMTALPARRPPSVLPVIQVHLEPAAVLAVAAATVAPPTHLPPLPPRPPLLPVPFLAQVAKSLPFHRVFFFR
jgi:hypothetical protein